jgi:hypothetical protein
VPFCSRAPEQNGGPTCDVRAMVLAVPIIPLACQSIAFCRGVSRVGRFGLLILAPAPNATGPAVMF